MICTSIPVLVFMSSKNPLVEFMIFLFANNGDEVGFWWVGCRQAWVGIRLIVIVKIPDHLKIDHANQIFFWSLTDFACT